MADSPKLAALLQKLEHPALKTIDLSLDRMHSLLALLGDPHLRLPPVIHVAGTNGKGSLIAYLKSMFEEAGYRAHGYISPHLLRFGERISPGGVAMADDAVYELLQEIKRHTETQPATFFEATTAAAFLAFSRQPADITLLETGMGGRLDATNVVPKPLLTAITPIGMDHAEYLGDTLPRIAAEKAAIMKQGVTCIVGPQSLEVIRLFDKHAQDVGANLQLYGRDWHIEEHKHSFAYRDATLDIDAVRPSLPGRHQFANAGMAIACVSALRKRFDISAAHIAQAVTETHWPGRLQRLESGPLTVAAIRGEVWLDGGHNPHAAAALSKWLHERREGHPSLRCHLIVGMMARKDARSFLAELSTAVHSVIAVPVAKEECIPPLELARMANALGLVAAYAANPRDAIQAIACEEGEHLFLIAGSLYLAGQVLEENN